MNGILFDIKKFALHDGPGLRTTVFFKGCPLRCLGCHNPESQSLEKELLFFRARCRDCRRCVETCPSDARSVVEEGVRHDRGRCLACGACVEICFSDALSLAGRTMTVEEVMAIVMQDLPFYEESGGGVTFSGGEPLEQPDFLEALLRACKERAIHTAVDTSGFAPTDRMEKIVNWTDLVLFDLKLMDEERHCRFTGRSNALVLENLTRLARGERDLRVRIPLIPGVNDDEENLEETARFLAGLPRSLPVDLLPYHRAGVDKYTRLDRSAPLAGTVPPDPERVAAAARVFRDHGWPVFVGGEKHGHDR